jgi:ankyrin repeat protein
VKLLLEKGAELETKSYKGWRPLSWAAAWGHKAVVTLSASIFSAPESARPWVATIFKIQLRRILESYID